MVTATKTKTEYQGQHGLDNETAQQLGEELDLIQTEHGDMSPETIEGWARRHSDSTWATELCWDKTKAAILYRRQQIRTLTRKIVLVQVVDDEPQERRAFISLVTEDKDDPGKVNESYIPVAQVMTEKEKARQVARQQFKRLRGHLPELASAIGDGWHSNSNQARALLSLKEAVATLGRCIGAD